MRIWSRLAGRIAMHFDRRRLFAALAGVASTATPALAREQMPFRPDGEASSARATQSAPRSQIDAIALGLRPNATEDQSTTLQRAIERAAAARAVLLLPPGTYRAGALQLPPFAAIAGVAGATRIVMVGGPSMLSATGSDHVSISDLVLDGASVPLPEGRGLVHFEQGRAVRIAGCEIVAAGGNGVTLQAVAGAVTGNTVSAINCAIFSNDADGLRIADNSVRGAGNGGILVWRSKPGSDGTLVVDNRIEDVAAKNGGSGQWGNAVNVFRADNVIVRGNQIRNAAFSAVRGNSASNLQIVGNTCTALGEVALYSEFSFEGAIIANNIVDGAAVGISVTNSNVGGRLAVVQGNLIRNLVAGRPPGNDQSDVAAYGIAVEADTAVSGNVVENVQGTGIQAGWGSYLRDVAITGNVVRETDFGIAVSVVPGAGSAVIANNVVAGARRGAIVGMAKTKLIAADLDKDGATRYAQLSIAGNSVR
jgi:uncharacterized secreted repeat protein (TIGR03808 family)